MHYRLLAGALPGEEKRIRTSYRPTLVLVVAVPVVVCVVLGLSKGATPKSMTIYSLAMAAYLVFLWVWYPRRMKQRLIRCWETYDLEIGNDYLLRRQADIPDLRLQFDEVQAVEHVPGRYLRVIGKSKGHVIDIPEGVDQFGDVFKTISSICPVRVGKNRAVAKVSCLHGCRSAPVRCHALGNLASRGHSAIDRICFDHRLGFFLGTAESKYSKTCQTSRMELLAVLRDMPP